MIGIILCCHGEMGSGMRNAAELIVGPQPNMEIIGLLPGQGQQELRSALKKAIRKVGKEDGALILTDLPGGTPCNVSISLVNEKIKMITGFNLPLLIKFLMGRLSETDPNKLVKDAAEHASEHILTSDQLLSQGNG